MLNDNEVQAILVAVQEACRHRKRPLNDLQPVHAKKLKKRANDLVSDWCLNGVPTKYWPDVMENCKSIVSVYNLVEAVESSVELSNHRQGNCDSVYDEYYLDIQTEEDCINDGGNVMEDQSGVVEDVEEEEEEEEDDDDDKDDEGEAEEIQFDPSTPKKLSLLQILRHFAAYTSQNQNDMSYLLTLLKIYEPVANYSSLPTTGKGLMAIDGHDWPSNGKSKKLPAAIPVGTDGKYLHFGVESALTGESPGVVYRDADLLQFVDIYVEEPNMLPESYIKRIEAFDKGAQTRQPRANLQSIPHFEVDIFIDELNPYKSRGNTMTPILGRMHSIRPAFDTTTGTKVLSESSPFIIGLFCGSGKPGDIDQFLKATIDELIRLSPETVDLSFIANRACTASLRCVIADTPMRAYLKRSKGHKGYWACDRCIQKGIPFKGNSRRIVLPNVAAPLRLS